MIINDPMGTDPTLPPSWRRYGGYSGPSGMTETGANTLAGALAYNGSRLWTPFQNWGNNTYQNALQHCMWACNLCAMLGRQRAWEIVVNWEIESPWNYTNGELECDPGDPSEWGNGSDCGMDLWNDVVGLNCCEEGGSCHLCCAQSDNLMYPPGVMHN
jgi:hypothetical protein